MMLCAGDRRNKHLEVCFQDGESCPVCPLIEQLQEAQGEIENLETELEHAK